MKPLGPYDLTECDKAAMRELIPLAFPMIYDPNNPLRWALERSKVPDYPDERPKDEKLPRESVSPAQRLLNLFDQHELDPGKLNTIAIKFKDLARFVEFWLPPGPEQTVCLRHLLDAKHAAVRALITDDTPVKT